jgi:hypothetical protein
MWEWVFGIVTLAFGVYALIKGRLQLSKNYVLEGNSARIAGGLLVAAPIIGAILTLSKQLELGIFNISCYSIVGVLAFAAFQARKSKRPSQREAQMKSEPVVSRDRNPTHPQVTQRQPDSSVKAQPEKKELPSNDRSEPKLSPITTCPNCGMRVLPKSDGTCPSCQARISA